jgi:hypothetical protein
MARNGNVGARAIGSRVFNTDMPGHTSIRVAPSDGSPLKNAIERITVVTTRLLGVQQNLEGQMDRVIGPLSGGASPSDRATDGNEGTPSGLVRQLHRAADLLERVTGDVEFQASRAEAL